MDEREEGELSGPEENVEYVPIQRPDASQYRRATEHLPSSDEDYDSDSDSDTPCLPKKKKTTVKKMDTDMAPPPDERMLNPPSAWTSGQKDERNGHVFPKKFGKRNNIWANVLGEQTLTEEIGVVGLKKLVGDRSVENYDYKAAQALMHSNSNSEEDGEIIQEEDMDMKEKRLNRKRPIHQRLTGQKKTADRHLAEIELDPSWSDEELGNVIAKALFEQRPELIVRVVQVLGREAAFKLYTDTRELEEEGGIMILDGSRRRTSGGVYLQLLKKLPDLQPEQLQKIFPPCEKQAFQQWGRRKRVPRKRVRHDSKPQGNKTESESNTLDDQLSDTAMGVKCPGSTPVTSPQQSDSDDQRQATTVVEQERLEESVVAAKLESKINKKDERSPPTFKEDVFEYPDNADEMELF